MANWTLFQEVLPLLCILAQLVSTVIGSDSSWDHRRAEATLDNRVNPPSARELSFWSTWAEWQTCTRSCGGGISSRVRYCQPRYRSRPENCPGDSRQHRLCSTLPCAHDGQDFRQKQCSVYNNRIIAGEMTRRWIPAQGHHGCDLKCRSLDHGTVYTFGKANDSTPCHKSGEHICLNGRCMEVGCDLLLGSTRRLDACGVCGGRNESCNLVRNNYVIGTHRHKTPEKGYEEVVVIPAGSTRINVIDTSPENYLALSDSRRRFLVNGNRVISWPGNYPVAGTYLNYSRQWQSESFHIRGPTKEDLHLMLLVYDKHGLPVRYEYWSPTGAAPKGSRTRPPSVPARPNNDTRPPIPSNPYPSRTGNPQKDGNRELHEFLGRMIITKQEELAVQLRELAKIKNRKIHVVAKVQEIVVILTWLKLKRLHEFLGRMIIMKQEELAFQLRELARINNWKVHVDSKVQEIVASLTRLKLKRESLNKPVNPDRHNSEPREGPGRNPEDYKQFGDPYAHRDPQHHGQNPASNPSSDRPSANDPRYYPEPRPQDTRIDPRPSRDPRKPDSHAGGQRPGKPTKGRCPPCKRVNEKVKNFCESDFVVRARVLDLETVGSETRYDLGIIESYKNTVYMSHREYVWSPAVEGARGTDCRCPRLRRNQDYVLMGRFDRNYRKRESRLLINAQSYVRKALPKRDQEMKNLKKVASRKCKRE